MAADATLREARLMAAGKFGMHADSMVVLHEGRELSELSMKVGTLGEEGNSTHQRLYLQVATRPPPATAEPPY